MSSAVILKSRIPQIVAELQPKLDAVAEAGATLVAATAQEKVAVDTGKLRDAIHVERVGVGAHAVVAGDEEAFYGMLVEHGTSHSSPQPFLIPALEEDRPEIIALAEAAIKVVL